MEEHVYNDSFFDATNIRKNAQNYSSESEGLLRKMVSKKPFMNWEIRYMNGNGKMKLSTLSTYIKRVFEHNRNREKSVTYAVNGKQQLN